MTDVFPAASSCESSPPLPSGLGAALERTAFALGRSEGLLADVPAALWEGREAVSEALLAGESLTLAQLLEDLALPGARGEAPRSAIARRWLRALSLARAVPSTGSPLSASHWRAVSSSLGSEAEGEPPVEPLDTEGQPLCDLLREHGGLVAASRLAGSPAFASPGAHGSRFARLASHALLHHSGLSARAVAPLAVASETVSSRTEAPLAGRGTASRGGKPRLAWLAAVEGALDQRHAVVRALLEQAERDAARAAEWPRCATSTLAVLAQLRRTPVATLTAVSRDTGICFPTTLRAMQRLHDDGVVRELTGRRSKRVFAYAAYVQLLEPARVTANVTVPPVHSIPGSSDRR